MQKLGKSVETRDEHFEHCLQQFIDQQVIRSMSDGEKNGNCVFSADELI